MTTHLVIVYKIVSTILNILLGFLAGKLSNVERDGISKLLFYFIAPIIFFSVPLSESFTFKDIRMTIAIFATSGGICCFAFWLLGYFYKDEENRNILAFIAGDGNCTYFLLPIVMAVFSERVVNLFMMGVVGLGIYESSIGYYICSKHLTTKKQIIIRVLKLPTFIAFISGTLLSALGFVMPEFIIDFVNNMKHTFAVLGMAMVGLGLSKLTRFEFDTKFTIFAFILKFIFHPLAGIIFIIADSVIFHFFDSDMYTAIKLVCIAPLPANAVVLATVLQLNPVKVSMSVLASSIFALIYVPIIFKYMF